MLDKQDMPQERFKVCMVHGAISERGRLPHGLGDLNTHMNSTENSNSRDIYTKQLAKLTVEDP